MQEASQLFLYLIQLQNKQPQCWN